MAAGACLRCNAALKPLGGAMDTEVTKPANELMRVDSS